MAVETMINVDGKPKISFLREWGESTLEWVRTDTMMSSFTCRVNNMCSAKRDNRLSAHRAIARNCSFRQLPSLRPYISYTRYNT
jgi:hypothetical protein